MVKLIYPRSIILGEGEKKVSIETQKLYDFAAIDDLTVELCETDEMEGYCDEFVDLIVYPKLTEKVVSRVAQLTNNRVVYSAEKQEFTGIDAYGMFLAFKINRAIKIRARSLAWRDANRLYREGRKVDREMTVIIDLDENLDRELTYEAEAPA